MNRPSGPRTASQELIRRRMLFEYDRSGQGCFASNGRIGRSSDPDEPQYSLSHTRRLVRALRERRDILFVGQTAQGCNIYLNPQKSYEADRLPVCPTRPIHHLWPTDAAAQLLQRELPKPRNYEVDGVHIPWRLACEYREEVIKQAVAMLYKTYGRDLQGVRNLAGVLRAICHSIIGKQKPAAEKRRSEATKATDLRRFAEMTPEQRQQLNALLGVVVPEPPPQAAAQPSTYDTVTQACERYLARHARTSASGTVRYYRAKLKAISLVLGERPVLDLSVADLERFLDERTRHGVVRQTCKKELKALLQVLREHGLDKLITPAMHRLVRELKPQNERRGRPFTFDEYEKVRAHLKPKRQAYLDVAVYTGCRRSELEALRVEHVDFDRKQLHIPGTKTEKANRIIPLVPVVAEIAARVGSGKLLEPWLQANRELAKACERAKVKRRCVLDCRHTFATWLKERGADDMAVSKLMGHNSTEMIFKRYAHLDQGLVKAMEKLPCRGPPEDPASSLQ